MNELTNNKVQLPENIADLSKFVLVNEERVQALKAQIRAIKKAKLAKGVYEQKLAEAQEVAEITMEAAMKMGQLLSDLPTAQGKRTDIQTSITPENEVKTKAEITAEMGITPNQVFQYEQIWQNPEAVKLAIQKAIENGDVVSRKQVMKEIKAERERVKQEQNQEVENAKHKAKTFEKELLKMQKLYGEMSEKWKVAEQQKERLLKQIEDPDAQRDARIKADAYSLCAGIGNFLERFGGMIYLKDELKQYKPKEKKMVMEAINSIYRWADEMLNTGMTEVIE